MKSLRQLSFIGLAIALVLTSCTMEERVYLPGYHTEWNKSKHNPERQQFGSNDSKNKNQTVTVEQSEIATNTVENSFALSVTDDNITASADNNSIIIPSHKTVAFEKKANPVSLKTNSIAQTKPVISNKKELKNKLKELRTNSDKKSGDDGDNGIVALRIFGWIIWACGILIILFASILAGIIICALGILFMVLGKKHKGSSSSSSNNDNKSEMQDVVYLENGSVIKGMIIEQTPNVSLKIQTKDGSIFVYKMEEVEKMTKELSK